MSVLDPRNPRYAAAGRALAAFNARHPWSHNDYYHGWILAHLPGRPPAGSPLRGRALDIGCGRGELLTRLAPEFAHVDGVDKSPAMRASAVERCAARGNVSVLDTPFEQLAGPYDLITMVAVLHHLDLIAALHEVRRLLSPGGRLLVVGLSRNEAPLDYLVDLASAVANPVKGVLLHPRPIRQAATLFGHQSMRDDAMPVRDPDQSFDTIAAVARAVLPGVRMHRRLYFRYTLEWTAPDA